MCNVLPVKIISNGDKLIQDIITTLDKYCFQWPTHCEKLNLLASGGINVNDVINEIIQVNSDAD
jgi:hypothetical protein